MTRDRFELFSTDLDPHVELPIETPKTPRTVAERETRNNKQTTPDEHGTQTGVTQSPSWVAGCSVEPYEFPSNLPAHGTLCSHRPW